MATTTDTLWDARLKAIMPDNFMTNRTTEYTAKAGIVENMINRIGRTIVAGRPNAYNPFTAWTRPIMDYGDTIQKYDVPYIQGRKPDYEPANPNPFATVKNEVKAQYWQTNDGTQYKNTIRDDQMKKAFISQDNFGSMVGELTATIYKSAGIDMFIKWKKYLSTVDMVTDDGKVDISYDETDKDAYGLKLWETIKDVVKNKLRYPSSKYNVMEFLTSSPSVDVIITTEAKNMMDNALRGVYNVDKIVPAGINFKEIDSFATADGKTTDTDVLIITSGMASYTPRTPIAGALYNPENYYTNYWYKEEGIFALDLAQNAYMISRGTA